MLLSSGIFFNSFFKGLEFLSYKSFTGLGIVIPRYLILLVTIVKGVAFLISLSDCLSFVYWGAMMESERRSRLQLIFRRPINQR